MTQALDQYRPAPYVGAEVALFMCPATEYDEDEQPHPTVVSGLWRIEAEYGDEDSEDWLLFESRNRQRMVVVDHEFLLQQVDPQRYGEKLAWRTYIEWAPKWQWDRAPINDADKPF